MPFNEKPSDKSDADNSRKRLLGQRMPITGTTYLPALSGLFHALETQLIDFKSLDFWIAVAVALLVKIKTSAQLGAWKVITTILVAIGAAWVGTEYAAEVFGVPEAVAAAIVTLTAEGVMRWVLIAVNNPREAIQTWREWRKP